jgi:hypothetical protein
VRSLGYTTVVITGRNNDTFIDTKKNLHEAGYLGFKQLYCRAGPQVNMTAVEYKSGVRQALVNQGWDIMGCVGDQVSDCAGGAAGYVMKVPNNLYTVY